MSAKKERCEKSYNSLTKYCRKNTQFPIHGFSLLPGISRPVCHRSNICFLQRKEHSFFSCFYFPASDMMDEDVTLKAF